MANKIKNTKLKRAGAIRRKKGNVQKKSVPTKSSNTKRPIKVAKTQLAEAKSKGLAKLKGVFN